MKKLILPSVILAFLFSPTPAGAHSFGKLYTLPVPFWLYLFGGAAAIALSFLVIGYFFNRTTNSSYPTYNLSQLKLIKILAGKPVKNVLKLVSLFLFVLTISTGLFGNDNSSLNFNMTFFWIIFVLGLTYLTALVGDLYSFLNPIKILVEFYEQAAKGPLKGLINYPPSLAYYPALILYFLFIWVELFAKTTPGSLAIIILVYLLISLLSVITIGKEAWFRYGDFFGVFFRVIGKIAPVEYKDGKIYLKPPFIGSLREKAEHFSLLLFILFMLSSTAFDGFHSTVTSYEIYYPHIHTFLAPLFGDYSYLTYQTLSLLVSPFLFLTAYLTLLGLTQRITRNKASLKEVSLQFAFSLIPIALAYNLAHYYTLILTEGQNIIYLLSDPFGYGWNLFKTSGYKPNLAVINASLTWNLQVAFILIGHIAGVYLAHLVALRVFPTHKKALLSQFPMLVLMIIYTMVGLWILSQPIMTFEN